MEKNKIIIEWHSIFKDIIKNLWVIVLCVLIGFMGIYIVETTVYEPEYTSRATLVVSTKGSGNSTISHLATSREMADILTSIFSDPLMKELAAKDAGLDGFDAEIYASVFESTNFLQISVKSGDPKASYDLLKSVLKVYPQISDNIFENAVINVLTPPSVPKNATNAVSQANTNLIISGIAVVSVFLIVVLSILRNTVKNVEAFEEKIDARLLGTIPHENKRLTLKDRLQKKKKSLFIESNVFISLGYAEQFHTIAAKLERENYKDGSKIFVVTSVAENEGKSTIASNIAISLANRGHKVALIDFDGKKPALYKIFGKKFNEQTELGHYFSDDFSGEYKFKRYKKTSLYLGLNTRPYREYQQWVESGKCKKIMDFLREEMDYVIVDTAPVSADTTITDMGATVDAAILVVRTDVVNVDVINDTIYTIENSGIGFAGCILNDVFPRFALLKMTGSDEGGYKYGKYGKYDKYGKYGKYAQYRNDTVQSNATEE